MEKKKLEEMTSTEMSIILWASKWKREDDFKVFNFKMRENRYLSEKVLTIYSMCREEWKKNETFYNKWTESMKK